MSKEFKHERTNKSVEIDLVRVSTTNTWVGSCKELDIFVENENKNNVISRLIYEVAWRNCYISNLKKYKDGD